MHRAHLNVLLSVLLAGALAGCNAAPEEQGAAVGSSAGAAAETDTASAVEPDAGGDYCELTGQDEDAGDCDRFERQYADLDAGRDAFSPQETMKEGETRTVSYAVTRLPKNVQGEGGELAEAVEPPPPPPPPPPPSPPQVEPLPPDMAVAEPDPTPDETQSGDGAEIVLGARTDPPASPAPTGPTQEEIDAAIAETDEQNNEALGADAAAVETGQIKVARFMYACLRGSPALTVTPKDCQSRDTREDPQVVWNWQVTATAPGRHQLNLRSGVEVRTREGKPRRIGQRAVNRTITVAVTRIGGVERGMKEAERWFNSPVKAIGALTALLLAVVGLVAAIRKLRGGKDGGGKDTES